LRGMWNDLGEARPTKTHYFIKLLEKRNMLRRLYTQNIDGLESACGIAAEKIIECHGTLSRASCTECKQPFDIHLMRRSVLDGQCPIHCVGCGGLVKPDITFFGEQLPEKFYSLARDDFDECDLLLILGTSLKVAPFNSLVSDVEDVVPRVLINREEAHGTGFDPLLFN